jgi:hypothetical protein
MGLPIATPGATGDHLADLILKLEDQATPDLLLTTLAVRGVGGVQAWVIVHLDDGGRERVSASDARLVAHGLRDAAGNLRQLAAWADSLEEAAEAAERQASATLLGLGAGRGIGPDALRQAARAQGHAA